MLSYGSFAGFFVSCHPFVSVCLYLVNYVVSILLTDTTLHVYVILYRSVLWNFPL